MDIINCFFPYFDVDYVNTGLNFKIPKEGDDEDAESQQTS